LSIEALPANLVETAPLARRPGMLRVVLRNPSVLIGATIVAFLAIAGALAPMLGTIDPAGINPVFRNKKPGVERTIRADDGTERQFVHRFGTDTLGRDVYSLVVYGARVSLIIGVTVAALSVSVGLVIGLITGYIRWLDGIIMRIMDGLMPIPGILLAIAEGQTFFEAETIAQTLDGERLALLFTITFPPQPSPLNRVLASITDITARKRTEETLQQAQAELAKITRVTTRGELTTSIANEVNQPLAAIVTNGSACLRWLATQPAMSI